jgi:ribosomal protein L32E
VAKRWRFTEGRKSSLRKAQREHVNLIEDGYKWRKAHGR